MRHVNRMLMGYQEGLPYPSYELRGAFSKVLLFESDVLKQSHKNKGKDDLEDILLWEHHMSVHR